MERANRVSVQSIGEGFVATFYRTHKKVGEIDSTQVEWVQAVDVEMNKTAQREMFRVWACENAQSYDIQYDPADRRTVDNQVPKKYDTDEILLNTAAGLVRKDVEEWVGKIQDGLTKEINFSIEAEDIEPVTVSPKNKQVPSKYNNGNWAWARVSVVVTVLTVEGEEAYITLVPELVSGQLKKPSKIGELGYTQTGFKTELLKDFAHLVKSKEESKPIEEPQTTTPQVEPTEEPKPKTRKKANKKDKDDTQEA